jgi:hypothetical protein
MNPKVQDGPEPEPDKGKGPARTLSSSIPKGLLHISPVFLAEVPGKEEEENPI